MGRTYFLKGVAFRLELKKPHGRGLLMNNVHDLVICAPRRDHAVHDRVNCATGREHTVHDLVILGASVNQKSS